MPRSFLSLIVWLQILILTGSLSDQSCRNSIWETTSQSHACLCLHKRLFALVLISPTPSHVCKSVSLSQRFNQRAIFFSIPIQRETHWHFLLSCFVGMDRIKHENLFFRRRPLYGLLDRKRGGSGYRESCGGRQGNPRPSEHASTTKTDLCAFGITQK